MRSNRPSRTARNVALSVVALDANLDTQLTLPTGAADATEQLLQAAGVASPRLLRWLRLAFTERVQRGIDRLTFGQLQAFGHRKSFCESEVRAAITRGATQILVLGAGYDTLAWRLASEFPLVAFFEIDHPATARVKARGIIRMGQPSNLHLLSEDLSGVSLAEALRRTAAWSARARTVFVAEGLLMYLRPQAVAALFADAARMSAAGSSFAFTYVDQGEDGRPDGGPATWFLLPMLWVAGEPWHWSIRHSAVDAFLRSCGWRPLPSRALARAGVERFAVAECLSSSAPSAEHH